MNRLQHATAFLSLRHTRFSAAFSNDIVTEVTSTREWVLTVFSRQSSLRPSSRRNWQSTLRLFLWFLSLLFVSTGTISARAAATQNGPIISSGPSLTLAIADFDGDRRLDLASVQT